MKIFCIVFVSILINLCLGMMSALAQFSFQNEFHLQIQHSGFTQQENQLSFELASHQTLIQNESGSLTIQSVPSGASFTVEGLPGIFTTPHTFSELPIQSYSIIMNLADYERQEVRVRVASQKENVHEVRLIPRYGYLSVTNEQGFLYISRSNQAETEISYVAGASIRLDVGSYQYRMLRSNQPEITGVFNITPGYTTILDADKEVLLGSLVVQTRNAQLFLSPINQQEDRLFTYQRGRPIQIEAGTYVYRLQREFYIPHTDTITILQGQTVTINRNLEPDYATIRVRANVRDIRLRSMDNVAPYASRSDELHLESGEREITVIAQGHADLTFRVFARSGQRIDTTVVLKTVADARDREIREQLPQGILSVKADVPDAEIFVNGESRGMGETSLYLIPDTYDVQVHHPRFGVNRKRVNVRSEALSEELFELRPSKQNAFMRSLILPGGGQLYSNQKRGYLYMAGAALAAGFTIRAMHSYSVAGNKYDTAFENYQKARTINDAAIYRAETLKHYNNQNQALDNIILGLTVFGGIYIIQLLDVHFITPQYGYKGTHLKAGINHQGVNLKVGF